MSQPLIDQEGPTVAAPATTPRPQPFWGIVDQGCSAASNFVLSVSVARLTAAREFGAFAVALVVPTVAILLTRSIATEPLFVRFAGLGGPTLRRGAEQALRAAISVVILLGVIAAAVGVAVGGQLGQLLVVGAVVAPLVAAQDAARAACFAAARPVAAAMSDAAWLVAVCIGFVALTHTVESPAAWQFLMIWGIAGGLAGVGLAIWAPLWPGRVRSLPWLSEHQRIIGPTLAAATLTAAPAQIVWLAMPLIAGLAELGRLRGAYVVFGPLGVLHEGMTLALLPHLTARARLHRILGRGARVTVALAAAATLWVLAVLATPVFLGTALFGQSWRNAGMVRLGLGVSLIAEAVLIGAALVLRATARQADLAGVRLRAAPLTVGGVLVGAWAAGAAGAAWGFALGYGVAAALGWRAVLNAPPAAVITLHPAEVSS